MHIFPGSNNDPKKCNVCSCLRLLKIEQINDIDYPKPELIAIPYKDGLDNFGNNKLELVTKLIRVKKDD